MNYSNLEKEIKEYSDYNKQAIITISKLSQFFKSFGQQGKKFIKSAQNSYEDFYSELSKENTSSTVYITYNYFTLNFKKYLKILEESFDGFESILGDYIEKYETHFKNSYGEVINQFTNFSNTINDRKEKLEKSKYTYFDSCKNSLELENKIIQQKDSKIILREDVSRLNEQFGKAMNNLDLNEQAYKSEIEKMNKLYIESESKYKEIIKKLRNNNIEKIRFFGETLKIFYNISKELVEKEKEVNNNIEKISENIKVNRDIMLYDDKFYFYNDNKKRFLLEQFLDFKKIKKNLSEKENLKDKNNKEEEIKNDIINKVFHLGKVENNFIEKDEEAKADNLFVKYLLFNEDKIDEKNYNDKLDNLKKKEKNIIRFMSVLITFYNSNENIKVKNHDNFLSLSNILDFILNTCIEKDKIYDLIFMIIFIAEKTLYVDINDIYKKQYLCEVLSANKNFQEPKFWTNLIDRKIKMLTNKKVKQEIERKESKDKEEEDKSTGVMSGFKNYFFSNKKKENLKLENEILSIQLYEEKMPNYAVETLEEYIHHFSSFKFDHKKSSGIIVDSSSLYKFNYKYVTYFIAKLNSNLYSIKNNNLSKNDKISEIDYDKLFFNTDKKHFKKILDTKIRGVIYSLKFLKLEELPKVLSLNKTYNESLLKIVYKNILIKYRDMDLKTHIAIWKIILGYSKVKKDYNYQKVLEQIKQIQQEANAKDIITLDVKRTNFENDKEKNREKISNILRCLSKCCPDVNYSQGMNFIAAFLLNIIGDEEEAFYLFLSLLLTSDYGSLFLNELAVLKSYFYVFERIIDILLPELYNHLKQNNIKVSFFISPWFITLFTDTYLNINNRENPKVLMRIWDLFLFNGCKSILKVGIALLKNFEQKIMTLTFEGLLKFLIGEIPKSEFFQNENYDNLMKTYYNFKIESELISNIENEYQIKKELGEEKI